VEILTSKYPLHESFCFKNIKKCQCGEIVNIDDYQDHFNENHEQINCEYCNTSMEKKEIKVHIPKCKERPISCKYCELELNPKFLNEHEYNCGSKTEQCTICLKYVQIKGKELIKLRF
jgi:hypothetical protein